MIKFSIHQGMISGQYEQSIRKYKRLTGKKGIWYVAIQDNPADNIYFCNKRSGYSKGFGGATLHFELEDGTKEKVQGPWHSNSDALYGDTGYDIRDKCLTQGIIAKIRKPGENYENIYEDVLHYDEEPVLGTFSRIRDLATELVKEHKCKLYYAVVSKGGGSSHFIDYKP